MPIRPENKDRYPADWPAISLAAKQAAQWRCACTGQCGRGTHQSRCPNRHGQAAYGTGTKVVLTTAHLNHQPEDVSEANLVAMCQGCHLRTTGAFRDQVAGRSVPRGRAFMGAENVCERRRC